MKQKFESYLWLKQNNILKLLKLKQGNCLQALKVS